MSFRLVKWYGDLTTETGDAVIGYAATLEAPLHLEYAACLEICGERVESRSALERSAIAELRGAWTWKAPHLEARFQPLQRSVAIDLLDEPRGKVQWHPVSPLCETRMTVGGRALEGLGYLERLELSIPPWDLPLERLVWGRFVHPRAGLVWIDWQGPHPLQVVLRDGERVDGAIEAERILAPGTELQIGTRRLLREGTLGRVALAAVSALSHVTPLGFLRTVERKALSRGRMLRGTEVLEGWIIDEVVTWAR
ncbi:MAG TPA: hypothetical protein VFI53_05260 [Myxococcaceae bacterium]|nr:hypothetical protein [Myxococcaceae bacterium]